MNIQDAEELIKNELGILGDAPFKNYDFMAFRHKSKGPKKGKWFALIMSVSAEKLGLKSDKQVDIINLKAPSDLVPILRDFKSIFEAYHMDKKHWISVIIDKSSDASLLKDLILQSYELSKG